MQSPVKKINFQKYRNLCEMEDVKRKCGDLSNSRYGNPCCSRNCDGFNRLDPVQ
jgi:hypothetical protein